MVVKPTCSNVWFQVCTRTFWQAMRLVQSTSQETRYSCSLFALKNSGYKTSSTESPTSTEHTWTISNPRQMSLFRRLQTTTGEYICRSLFCCIRFWNAPFSMELAPLLAASESHEMSVRLWLCREMELFAPGSARFRWPPVKTGQDRRTDGQMDNCNFSIKIVWYKSVPFWLSHSHIYVTRDVILAVVDVMFVRTYIEHWIEFEQYLLIGCDL